MSYQQTGVQEMGTGRMCHGSSTERMAQGKSVLFSEQILFYYCYCEQILCAIFCETPSFQAFSMFSLLRSPAFWALQCNQVTPSPLCYQVSHRCFGVGVIWDLAESTADASHSGLYSCVLSYQEKLTGKPSIMWPLNCCGSFTLREAPTVTVPARDH